jgi:formylglycine-generating enzyme required for sulfatase activity
VPRRPIITATVLLFLVSALAVLWSGFGWPPPRLILKHGFPPTGGPTGRTMTIEGVEFVELKPGYFRMGSHFLCKEGDLLGRICALLHLPWGKRPKHDGSECPPHWVEVCSPYWITRTEITNWQYERFDPNHQRSAVSPGSQHSVTDVSWEDARRYCDWLSLRGELTARLPSESEWENAARAGSEGEYSFGDDEDHLRLYGWFYRNSGGRAHETRMLLANAWGLYDMHGNVREWCEDCGHNNYDGAPVDGSAWTSDGDSPYWLVRGGSWGDPAAACRSAWRDGCVPSMRTVDLGLRLAGTVATRHGSQVN